VRVKIIHILLTGFFGILFLVLFGLIFVIGIQIFSSIRINIYAAKDLFTPGKSGPHLDLFSIANPYDCPGRFYKAQLHLHTSNSKDVATKLPVTETILKYKKAGYHFVVITDHDTITTYPELNSSDFICIPGVEITLPFVFWPLGKHLVVINPGHQMERLPTGRASRPKLSKLHFSGNALMIPAHPNWRGNLGTGYWYLKDILKMGDCRFVEIYNVHSDSSWDVRLWHQLLTIRGYQKPVWGIAVDDTDNGEPLDLGWIMVKTKDISENSLITAVKNGCFYATTGPEAGFQVEGGRIEVTTTTKSRIDFIDAQNKIVASFSANSGRYQPRGQEGFIRVEIRDENGRAAWSQPFFLIPALSG
jgi:hypothetical protein